MNAMTGFSVLAWKMILIIEGIIKGFN